jgi:hypothetical protein
LAVYSFGTVILQADFPVEGRLNSHRDESMKHPAAPLRLAVENNL